MKRAAVITLVLGLVATGCGGGGGGTTATATTAPEDTSSQGQPANAAEECLREAGLSNVEQRDVNLWRGFNIDPFFGVVVQSFRTAAKAKRVTREADLVYAYPAGRYVVTGPAKTGDDNGITEAVARCLD